MSVPSLFKYVSPDRVADIFEKERIKFSAALEFNDPFDMHPTVAHITDSKFLDQIASQIEKEDPAFKGGVNELLEKKEFLAASIQRGMLASLNKQAGVFCLCAVKDSLLMWAHYADHHRGFVLEFDTANPEFRKLGKPHGMTYSPDRAIVDARNPDPDLAWLLTKSKEWLYEEEYRIFRKFQDCIAVEKGGKTIYLFPLPKQAIKAVYLGVNAEHSLRDRVLSTLKETPVSVFQAELPRQTFELNFKQVK